MTSKGELSATPLPESQFPDFRETARSWFRSASARLAAGVAVSMYLAYAIGHGAWGSITLIALSVFVAGFLPIFATISNRVTDWANDLFGLVTGGRLARFGIQLAFNLAGLSALYYGGAIRPEGIAAVGHVWGAAVLTTLASQGAQYFGLFLFQRRVGDWYRNILLALSATVFLTGLGTAGLPIARELFLIAGVVFGAVVFGLGILSDIRAFVHPKGGIGIFLGTFNPFHRSHLRLVREALEKRRLEKIIIHPTIVPWLHARALQHGEIRVAGFENGYQVYELTDKADIHANYFPTGNRFLLPGTRRRLIELAIEEAGLGDRVEVAYMPDVYRRSGFFGVIREIRRANPGKPLHGIHGSDFGGMHARLIMDESGWIYPMPFLRRDGVSATAIRGGVRGLTARTVEAVLRQLSDGLVTPSLRHGRMPRRIDAYSQGGFIARNA